MQKKIRPNVLRLPQGIRPESLQKAQAVLQSFTKHLRTLNSVPKAAAKAAAETGARVEIKPPPEKPKTT